MHFQSLSKKVLVIIGAIHLYTSAQLMPDVTVFYIEFGILNEIRDINFTIRGMLLFGGGGDVVYPLHPIYQQRLYSPEFKLT